MLNFEFKNPTKIHFGKGLIAKIVNEIPAHAKVLMLYDSLRERSYSKLLTLEATRLLL
jgi:alcohol dehydrogenase YqhD (iron-dependent ADH family)